MGDTHTNPVQTIALMLSPGNEMNVLSYRIWCSASLLTPCTQLWRKLFACQGGGVGLLTPIRTPTQGSKHTQQTWKKNYLFPETNFSHAETPPVCGNRGCGLLSEAFSGGGWHFNCFLKEKRGRPGRNNWIPFSFQNGCEIVLWWLWGL